MTTTCRKRTKRVFSQRITATVNTTLKKWWLHMKFLLFIIFSEELQKQTSYLSGELLILCN